MSLNWTRTRDKDKYGIAVYNYNGTGDFGIRLDVGDTVHIHEELGSWYLGGTQQNKNLAVGVFPKGFVKIKDCIVDKTGHTEVVAARIPLIVQELTSVLREWGYHLRLLYVTKHKNLEEVRTAMWRLIKDRTKILSKWLPTHESKELKQHITEQIDYINGLLGLDLVVRDVHGNILNPDVTSAIKLYRHHEEATQRLKKMKRTRKDNQLQNSAQFKKPHLSWTAMLSITNIVFKVLEPCEVSLALYWFDGPDSLETPLTESYVFSWLPEGYNANTDLLSNLKCLFTELSTKSLAKTYERAGQLLLIGFVVRQGSMAAKEVDPRRQSQSHLKKFSIDESIRRPFGAFACDLTTIFQDFMDAAPCTNLLSPQYKECFANFLPCGEKDSLESIVRKIQSLHKTDANGHGVWMDVTLFNGDLKQLEEENPHYLSFLDMPVAYQLKLRDIVVPGDVRNDLYITLVSGEFVRSATKTSDRNVEVIVEVCNKDGVAIPGVIRQGCGKLAMDRYRSVTYYHEARPRWVETFLVKLPIDEFKQAHVRFLFKHRSTKDQKDQNEKPFAMSFIKLMQKNGTTLANTNHELLVYKIEKKQWDQIKTSYLEIPWNRSENIDLEKFSKNGLTLSNKDSFSIATSFCSTKLTQNADLLSLLEWPMLEGNKNMANKDYRMKSLKENLKGLESVPREEQIIFLQDTLDVLFKIIMKSEDSDSENLVFDALVDVIYIAAEQNKYESMKSVLDSYIEQNFHSTLAYSKMTSIFMSYINNVSDSNKGTLNKALKSLQYIMKFIIRSRQLFVELHSQGYDEFGKMMKELLNSLAHLMSHSQSELVSAVQGQCLKYISTTIPDIITVFDAVDLSKILIKMLSKTPERLSPQKLQTMKEIVHSDLFNHPVCRELLLESFTDHIKQLLRSVEEMNSAEVVMRHERSKNKKERIFGETFNDTSSNDDNTTMVQELNLCVNILGDILDVLFSSDIGITAGNINYLTSELLRDILSIIGKTARQDPLLCPFVAVYMSLLRQISDDDFRKFLESYSHNELVTLLVELLMVTRDLVEHPVFKSDWSEMILLQNSILMKILRLVSDVIYEKIRDPFSETVWNNFFQCAVKFITQDSLQLERFSASKRSKIISRYKDLRLEASIDVKRLWFSLGSYKIKFILKTGNYSVIGLFLEMTMIPESELRRQTIPIFFDMMQCEFYSSKDGILVTDSSRKSQKVKGKFDDFERELLEKMDHLVVGGYGDEHYREVFGQTLGHLCENHTTIAKPGLKLVRTVQDLMERLLQYRTIMNSSEYSLDTRMSCTVNLLEFYLLINCNELYLRYVYKLQELHLKCDNYTEAAHTLLLHANLLSWHSEPLEESLRSRSHCMVSHHDVLKEKLFDEIIALFDKGKMWESALNLCKELVVRHEDVTMDYSKLALLHEKMAIFYNNIMKPDTKNVRPIPEYFRVAYWGRGFPAFLQNKIFVYRGNGYERLADFQSRILDQFPNAELMTKLTPPSEEAKDSPEQYIQINKVDCLTKDTKYESSNLAEAIRSYYAANHVDTFVYSRPFHRGPRDSGNEFATLFVEKTTLVTTTEFPGILRCFPVVAQESVVLSPIENAIEAMNTKNNELRALIKRYINNPHLELKQFTMKVHGIVDAAVQGGVSVYEKAFLCPEYIENNPKDLEKIESLKYGISKQIPLLEMALQLNEERVSQEMLDHHNHMKDSFNKIRNSVQEKYGVCPPSPDLETEMRSRKAFNYLDRSNSARLSNLSTSSGNEVTSISSSRLSYTSKVSSTVPSRKSKLSDTGTLEKKNKREKPSIRNLWRRESFIVKDPPNTSQWYERSEYPQGPTSPSPIIELPPEPLIPSRPPRPDSALLERRRSRPSSINLSLSSQTATPRGSSESLVSVNSPSGNDDDDIPPPPLPIKNRNIDLVRDSLNNFNNHHVRMMSDHLLPDENSTPPEKPPKPQLNHLFTNGHNPSH